MHFTLARKLFVPNVAAYDFSRAVSFGVFENTVKLEATIYALTGGASSVTATLQGSNDKQNWTTVTTWSGLVTGYNQPAAVTDIAFRWVRLRWAVVGGGGAVVAAGLNTEHD
ncbi:MAG: hypothetical protein FD180_4298 [Planctomycetota bacterium]|nr:MAG: hypothetical protein FD180_4298 [Planctomycetota bacterium]